MGPGKVVGIGAGIVVAMISLLGINADQPDAKQPSAPVVSLSDHLVEACKASLATMNARDPASFTGQMINETTAHVAWRSPDHDKLWQARCEAIDNDHIRWAAFDAFGRGEQGRWRDEDKITVSIDAEKLTVALDQGGVNQMQKAYPLAELASRIVGKKPHSESDAKLTPSTAQSAVSAQAPDPSRKGAYRVVELDDERLNLIGEIINSNGYLCARPAEVVEAGAQLYGVHCITKRDGTGRSNYLFNSRTGEVTPI